MFRIRKLELKLREKSKALILLLERHLSGASREKKSYLHCPGEQPLLFKTVGRLVDEAAERFGDKTAFVSYHQKERISFSQTKEKTEQFASGFLSLGMTKGDRVALWAPNSIEWYLINLALAKCGAISVFLNPAYKATEVKHCMNKVGAKFLIAADSFKTQNYYGMIEEISPEIRNCQPGKLKSKNLPTLETVVIMTESDIPGVFKFKDLCLRDGSPQNFELKRISESIEPEEPCNIQFTSGTTGNPKAAVLSHFATVNNSYFISLGQELHLKEHKMCLLGPFFHAMGSVMAILTCLHHGTTLVIPDYSFNPDKSISCIKDERCTIILGTPTMYVDIFQLLAKDNLKFSFIELAISGGAPCTPELYRNMLNVLGAKRAAWVYGMTETGPVTFMTTSSDSDEKLVNSVGRLMQHTEAKVVGADGATLPCNEKGELWVRSSLLMREYWNDVEKTKEILAPTGWLKTGDQFVISEDGYGQIVGRIKDIIIRGGENIFPADVEEHLITHPDIVDVQVVGIPDARLGEQVCACLLTKPESKLTKNEIQQYCKGKIAHFKVPHYVYFFENFPKTASGKIQRYQLKERVLRILKMGS